MDNLFRVFNDEFDKIKEQVAKLENLGYKYFCDDNDEGKDIDEPDFAGVKIKLPSGEFLRRYQIDRRLENLKLGNAEQIESLHALNYLYLKQIDEGIRDGF